MEDDFDIADEFEAGEETHIGNMTAKLKLPSRPGTVTSTTESNKYRDSRNNNSRNNYTNKTNKPPLRQRNDSQQNRRPEDKECTFQPNISKKGAATATPKGGARNIQEFLRFQKGCEEKKNHKLEKIKQELSQRESAQFTGRPSIDRKSKRIASRNGESDQPAYLRLSRQKEIDRWELEADEEERNKWFQPQINIKSKSLSRKENVSKILYNDAQRRQQKEKTARDSLTKREGMTPKINNNTDKLVLKAIRQEFEQFTSGMTTLSPIVALSILSQMFNIDLNPKKDSSSEAICDKLFKYIGSAIIEVARIWKFIEIVVNGANNQTASCFSLSEQEDIVRSFAYFYRCRLTKDKKTKDESQPTFRPEILKNADKLAAKKREKMLADAQNLLNTNSEVKITVADSKDIPLTDVYILERMHRQEQYQQKRLQKEQKQMEECTFKPVLNEQRSVQRSINNTSLEKLNIPIKNAAASTKRFKIKTEMGGEYEGGSQTENTLMTMHTQYSFDKEKSKHSLSRDKQSKIHEIKDIEKTVLRLSAARKDREFSNMVKERGYPKEIKNWENFRQHEKKAVEQAHHQLKGYSKKPVEKKGFIFDVHIGNGVLETIQINKDTSITKAVEAVAKKHSFDQTKKQRLIEQMTYHLRTVRNQNNQNQVSNV